MWLSVLSTLCSGEEVTVTRKGQDNYCFVEFETAAKATDFMTKYNHRLLREWPTPTQVVPPAVKGVCDGAVPAILRCVVCHMKIVGPRNEPSR